MAAPARVVSLPLPLLAQCRLRHGPPRPLVVAAKTTLFVAVRCGVDGVEAPPAAVPRSVPVRVAYELQQAGHLYLDVRVSMP